jgi:thymidylate synthase
MLKPSFVTVRNLNELWFKAIEKLLTSKDCCRVWTVEGKQGEELEGDTGDRSYIGSGSYVGKRRWEFDFFSAHITNPGDRPIIPDVPVGIPAPTDMKYVEDYYKNYLLGNVKGQNEIYTYGERISKQIEPVIEKYMAGFGTNQCCIEIGQPSDIKISDPPCLRLIDSRVYPDTALREGEKQALHFTIYFRSWDLWSGLPSNLAGLRLLQEYIAGFLGVEAGEMIVMSKGLHLYEDSWNSALKRIGEPELTPDQIVEKFKRRKDTNQLQFLSPLSEEEAVITDDELEKDDI